jgi:hypothetical protein
MDPDTDLDPDAALFVIDLQDANKNYGNFLKMFFCLLLFDGTFTSFFNYKKSKKITKQ